MPSPERGSFFVPPPFIWIMKGMALSPNQNKRLLDAWTAYLRRQHPKLVIAPVAKTAQQNNV